MATSICAGTYVRVGFRVLGGSTILWTTTTTAIVGLLSFPCETAIISSLSLSLSFIYGFVLFFLDWHPSDDDDCIYLVGTTFY